MTYRPTHHKIVVSILTIVFTAVAPKLPVQGHGGAHSAPKSTAPSGQSKKSKASDYRAPDNLGLKRNDLTPINGGQVSTGKWHYFEVVYTPKEMRVYVYSPSGNLLNARGLKGNVELRVRGNPTVFRYQVKYALDVLRRGHGSVQVDLTRVRDGDMEVTFDLERLPFKEEKKARFSQTFFLTRPGATVQVLPLDRADEVLVAQQRVCPIMGTPLGEHGLPIKLMVGKQRVFVCCEGCIEQVRKAPQRVADQSSQMVNVQAPARRAGPDRPLDKVQRPANPVEQPWLAVYRVNQEDTNAIRNQGTCPMMGTRLGEHGAPLRVVLEGRQFFVCCEGCVGDAVRRRHSNAGELARKVRISKPQDTAHSAREFAEEDTVQVSYATPMDRSAVDAQGVCPIRKTPLGSHGTPLKVAMNDKTVFVCCEGCVPAVKKDPRRFVSANISDRRSMPYQGDVHREFTPAKTSSGGSSCCSSGK